jgi:hypothetical protein
MIYSSTSGKILIGKEALNGVGKMGVKVMKGELTSEWGGILVSSPFLQMAMAA